MKLFLQTYNRIKAALICLLILSIIHTAKGQELASYTQYMDNLTPLNNTYSLFDKAASVYSLAREEFIGVPGAPNTFIFDMNLPIPSVNGAAGLVLDDDNFGVEHQLTANVYFAKSIQFDLQQYLAVSLNAGLRNYVANYAGLAPGDPVFVDNIHETAPNIGFGVMYYKANSYYMGVSVPQLTFRDLGDGSLLSNNYFRNHYFISGGFITDLSDGIKLKPAVLFSAVRGVPLIADMSATLYFKEMFGIGLNYRTDNEMAAVISYNVGQFHIGYSYQFGTTSSNIDGLSTAIQEVTLSYRFGNGAKTPRSLL